MFIIISIRANNEAGNKMTLSTTEQEIIQDFILENEQEVADALARLIPAELVNDYGLKAESEMLHEYIETAIANTGEAHVDSIVEFIEKDLKDEIEDYKQTALLAAANTKSILGNGDKLVAAFADIDLTDYDFVDSLIEGVRLASQGKPNNVGELLFSQVKYVANDAAQQGNAA